MQGEKKGQSVLGIAKKVMRVEIESIVLPLKIVFWSLHFQKAITDLERGQRWAGFSRQMCWNGLPTSTREKG